MTRLQKWLGGISALALLIGGALVAKPVLASMWETVSMLRISGNLSAVAFPQLSVVTTTWDVTTSGGSYYEYRSLYYTTNTFSDFSDPATWTEWTECRREGAFEGVKHEICNNQLPGTTATSTIAIRASTHFSGCGTYTPVPDESSCGHTTTTYMYLIP